MALRLIVDSNDRTLRIPLVEGSHRLGSSPGCAVRIAHPSISRRHAMIHVEGGRAEIEDLGSRNGTRVASRKVDGRRPLAVGDTILLGAVAAVLEEISDKDLEPAVAFAVARPEPAKRQEEAPAATAALGTTRVFALELLPDLLARLSRRCGAVRMAQAVGAALFESLPCLAVEVTAGTAASGAFAGTAASGAFAGTAADHRGVLFSARHEEVGDDVWDHESRAESGGFVVRVAFVHPSHLRSYAPMADTGALLISLADGAETPAVVPAPGPAPALPEPPTVVPEVRRIYADAGRVARGDVSVLIRGASGTGKEVLARYLHAASNRSQGPFVALNCAALPRDLLESELFGIERGVATGVESRAGKFEMAAAGTLFLDEIGDMAPPTQAKVLRALEERKVYRVGGRAGVEVDVRFLAATHRDLEALIEEGAFRQDLYHRLAAHVARIPPLRERREDVALLAGHFFARELERTGTSSPGLTRGALGALCEYSWPGNVRELILEIAQAVLLLDPGEPLGLDHLSERVRSALDLEAPPPLTLDAHLRRAERQAFAAALAAAGGDAARAIDQLGVSRATFYRKVKELGLETGD